MKPLVQPEVSRGYTTANGIRLLITSWPFPVRNNRGRVIAFRHDDILSTIRIDAFLGDESHRNPDLLGCSVRDLEDPEHGGVYQAELERDLHVVLCAMGCSAMSDYTAVLEAVTATRASLYRSA